jgi:hypothetical protein
VPPLPKSAPCKAASWCQSNNCSGGFCG